MIDYYYGSPLHISNRPSSPRVRNSHIVHKGHQIKIGLEDGFCNKNIKLYKNKKTKKFGEDKIKVEKVRLHIYLVFKNSTMFIKK